jgi:Zn-dependent alcohol dehydrogenase
MKITAAVVPVRSAPFEIETLDLAAPLADEVLVRVVASGMCHTDLHARDGYFPNLPYPVVCGHEGAGIVEQVGAAVADLAPGDSIVISFPWCGDCRPCRAERFVPACSNRAAAGGTLSRVMSARVKVGHGGGSRWHTCDEPSRKSMLE